jgi:3-deoxy-D-manno-octulosonate cytidylyltransferase
MGGKMAIRILDCTLRDGGYINDWQFKNHQIETILLALTASRVDIIECGYLNSSSGEENDTTCYRRIEDVRTPDNRNALKHAVVMINHGDYDIKDLPPKEQCNVEGIRLAFHQKESKEAIVSAQQIIALGYRLYLQPMITKNYTEEAFLSLVAQANRLGVYAFYIVDSFGSMLPEEFQHYMQLADTTLHPDIALGYHSHNNMQLAFSNAMMMCHAALQREVIIDASIYGIGRGAGNLNTELIADYLNRSIDASYATLPMLEVIDTFLSALMVENPWGFSPAQYLSASFDCHPNYAKYLIDKNTNHIVGVQKVLAKIPTAKQASFDKVLIEKLYIESLLEPKNESVGSWELPNDKKVLLIASGSSVEAYRVLVEHRAEDPSYVAIALNHMPNFACDYYFFSNQKRFDEFKEQLPLNQVILSNNIGTELEPKAVVDLQSSAFVEGRFVKNVAIVAMNHLFSLGITSFEIAGLDGYDLAQPNYSYDETNVILDKKAMQEENKILRFALERLSVKIAISFLTPSLFSESTALRILGVIPARYKSSRFEGKPLCLIKDIPMIKRTYMQAKHSTLLTDLVVATDSAKIEAYCHSEGIPVVMTSEACLTGTDRLAEVASMHPYDLYVNIQGDEPVIDYHAIDEVVAAFQRHGQKYVAYNLYKEIDHETEVQSDTIIKVIVNEEDELLYMSRLPVPFNKSDSLPVFKKQVCVYGFTKQALELFSNREKTLNEQHEDIEILRFIDMGYKVKMSKTSLDSIAVDVPDDIQKVEAFLDAKGLT